VISRRILPPAAPSKILPIVIGLVIALGHVPTAAAQSQAIDGTIEGFVRGQDGQPVAGVAVKATNVQRGYERTVTSDTAGRYFIPLLPPGDYVIAASKQ